MTNLEYKICLKNPHPLPLSKSLDSARDKRERGIKGPACRQAGVRIWICFAFCILLVPSGVEGNLAFSPAFAEGQAGMDIAVLKAGVGARPLGMGGAFTAVADTADAPYWNPAGLGSITQSEITTMQTKLSTDADHYYISYVRPAFGGALGISWIQVGLGNITKTSSEVNQYNEVQNLSIFSYFSNAYLLSFGKEINERISIGLTAKYLTSNMTQILGGQGYGYSFTPGVLIQLGKKAGNRKMSEDIKDESKMLRERRLSGMVRDYREGKRKEKPSIQGDENSFFSGLTLGIKIDELFNQQSWGTGTLEQVSPQLRIGLAYRSPNPGTFAIDITQPIKNGYGAQAAVGYEWSREGLSLRTGYCDGGLSAGAGFTSGRVRLDYAYVTQRDLSKENVHRISLSGIW